MNGIARVTIFAALGGVSAGVPLGDAGVGVALARGADGDEGAAPLIITRRDIDERGYRELSEVLDDLPGMDVVRGYGSSYLRVAWRGGAGADQGLEEGFVVMVDGVVSNQLAGHTAETPLVALPLSHVQRIEVSAGSASVAQGAGAAIGVINIVTNFGSGLRDDDPPGAGGSSDGSFVNAKLSVGNNQSRIADLSTSYRAGSLRVGLAARLDDGWLDDSKNGFYEYSKDLYYGDRRLWGATLDDPGVGGRFHSPYHNRAVDARLGLGGTELGLLQVRLASGFGVESPGDRVQNDGLWAREESSVWLRRTDALGKRVSSVTLLRYRRSDLGGDSFRVDRAGPTYWQSLNAGWSATQDFAVRTTEALSLDLGVRYQQKDRDRGAGPFPTPPAPGFRGDARFVTDEVGAHLQARHRWAGWWRGDDTHQLSAGFAFDHGSHFGEVPSLQAAYAGDLGPWRGRLVYAEGFLEPGTPQLYAPGAPPGGYPVKPQRTRTFEASVGHVRPGLDALIDGYLVRHREVFSAAPVGPRNLGERSLAGIDLRVEAAFPIAGRLEARVWTYYTQILASSTTELDAAGGDAGTGDARNLAPQKLQLGVTAGLPDYLTVTLRGRFIGRRDTIASNPIPSVDPYVTCDGAVLWRDFLVPGIGVGVAATNLFNQRSFHPGLRAAGAGQTPGFFDAAGVWHGSEGPDSSLLAQPGRRVLATLELRL